MKHNHIILYLLVSLIIILTFTACGNNAAEKPLVEQIDEQLAGTWISYDSATVLSKWTFFDGRYVVDTYVNGKKIDNASIGTYFIGTESIHTITADQKKNVEGSIPFSFKDGNLALHGATGDLKKNIK